MNEQEWVSGQEWASEKEEKEQVNKSESRLKLTQEV